MTTPRTAWFTHDRFGLFIHYGLSSLHARDLSWPMSWEKIPSADWSKVVPRFNPDLEGPREWVRLAKRAGCAYAVFTAKHHEGFCQWDSKVTAYNSVNAPACGRDLVREFVDACAEEGIRPGLYLSLIDWHHPDYPADRLHPERDNAEARDRPRAWKRYVETLHAQARELLTHYGKIDVLWLDFSYDAMSGEAWDAEGLMALVRSLQPDILVDNRLVAGHEDPSKPAKYGDFATPEQAVPYEGIFQADGTPVVWEACMTLGDRWGYARDDHNFKSPAQALRMLIECVAKGGNLLLNIGPNARGMVRPEERAAMENLGDWMRLHAESIRGAGIATARGKRLPKPNWGWYTRKGDTVYAHLLERPAGTLPLPGLGGCVEGAHFVHDGSEIKLGRSWNSERGEDFEVLQFHAAELPHPIATVIALRLKPGC